MLVKITINHYLTKICHVQLDTQATLMLWRMLIIGFSTCCLACYTIAGSPLCFLPASALLVLSILRYQVLTNYLHKLALFAGSDFEFMPLSLLKKRLQHGELFLGKGFIWQKQDLQCCIDIIEQYKFAEGVTVNPKTRGLRFMQALSPNQALYVPLKFLEGHTLITGTTGAGKTRLFDLLIGQAIMRGETVIIVDPKGDRDLCEHAREVVNSMGDPHKFKYFHPGFPEKSIHINPLYSFNRTTELASRIATLIPTAKGVSDPFKNFAQYAINTIIGGLLLCHIRPSLQIIRYYVDGRTMELSFEAFKTYFNAHMPERYQEQWATLAQSRSAVPGRLLESYNKFYQQTLQKTMPSAALEALFKLARHDPTHYSKMISSLISVLDSLTLGELGALLSPNKEMDLFTEEWNFANLIERNTVTYLGLDSLTDNLVGGALGSLFLADLAAVAGARYNYADKITPVNLFIDECAEVVSNELIQLLNKGRGAGFRIYIATQTVADFEARLGSSAKALQVLGNVNNVISLRVIDNNTKEYISDLFPKVRIATLAISSSQNQSSDSILKVSTAVSETHSEEEMSIFPPQLLNELPDLEFIAKIGGSTVYKGQLPFIIGDSQQK